MQTTIRVKNIDFELTELLSETSVHDKTYNCVGYCDDGSRYTGIAEVSCGEIVSVSDISLCNAGDPYIKKQFNVKNNVDRKRFEFTAITDETTSYTVKHEECDSDESNAWIALYLAVKKDYPDLLTN